MKFDDGIFGLYSQFYENRREVELLARGVSRRVLRRSVLLCGAGRAAAEGDRRADHGRHQPGSAARPHLHEPDDQGLSRLRRDFFGMEETIERIVGFFRHAAQGLEERKQILYLLGPVGGGKSSLAERLKQLMEKEPVYVLKAGNEISPVFESPLGLFDPVTLGAEIEKRYGIPRRRLTGTISPWAVKRLEEFGGDITKFTVVRLQPSRLKQICIAKTEPGDENNQDVVEPGRQGRHPQARDSSARTIPTPIPISGGLNRTTQGLLEFVEMFKAPIKMLHPLLTATQEGNYVGTENIGGIPYQGIILAHSNEAEWQSFKNNKNNEAFIDRISVIKVPYCLRSTEERKIYEKLLQNSELADAPCAPSTLDILARFCVLSRLKPHENSNLYSKMRVYDGESLKDTDPARQVGPGIPRRGRRRRGHGRHLDPLCLQGAVEHLQLRHAGGRGRSGASDVCARAGDLARAVPGGRREEVPQLHQGRAGAALCRVHRPRDPEGLSRILLRLRPEPVRPLRRLRRRLDRGPGLQGSRHRPADEPRAAEPGAVEDREAGRHRQPEGLPQRGGQVRAAGARQQRGPQPVLDLLREVARGHRAAHVLAGRGSAAGHQLRHQEGHRDREEARRLSSSAWSRAATPSGKCAGWSSGTCGSTRPDRRPQPASLEDSR